MHIRHMFVPMVAFALAAACGEGPPPEVPADPMPDELSPADPPPSLDAATIEYAPELEIDFATMERTADGLYIRDDEVGDGDEVGPESTAVVHYTGYHPDGSVFDTSRDGDQPFSVNVGAGGVIRGWLQGLPGMRVGGHRTLVIPPHLAYGPAGRPPVIPPNAVLVFRIELVEVR